MEDALELTFEEWLEKYGPKYRNLAGVRKHLNNRFGKGEWGDTEFVQYMQEIYDDRRQKAEVKHKAEQERRKAPPVLPHDADFEDRIQAYLDYYENPAPNDRVMIEAMATLEIAIRQAQQQLMNEMAEDQPARNTAKVWSDQMRNLMGEHRRIQDALGISRASREREEKGADQQEYVQDVIRRSAAFVKEHAIQIRCPYCAAEEAQVEINMGFILFHFRRDVPWQFGFECPRCGQSASMTAGDK